jgi:hypothetical protein
VDAMVIDQDALHFKVCLLAGSLIFIFDERVLKGIVGSLVADYFAREDRAKAAEY